MAERVREILSWYAGENPGVLTNLHRLMNHGKLAGTGKFVILPVDQGFEHGPARSFAPNPPAYDPRSPLQLATDFLEQKPAKEVYEKYKLERDTLAKRVAHIVKCAFDGRRVVIFSGGAKKDDDNALLDEARAIRDGGGFGSIMGRNAFQRSKSDSLKLLGGVMSILKGETK